MSPVVTWSIALQLVCSSPKVTSLHPAFAITASALRIRFRYLARSGGNRPASLFPHPCPHSRPLSKAWSTCDYTNIYTAPQSPTHTPSTTQPPTAHLQPAGCTGCAAHLPLSPYTRPTTNRQHPGMPHVPALLLPAHLLFHPPPL